MQHDSVADGGQSGRSVDPHVIDSDVDLHDPAQAGEIKPRQWDILLAIAIGGATGAEARYGLGLLVEHRPGQFPWSTTIINVSGSLLLGVLMVFILELTSPHRLARPFLGVGVLGGYTTFSTFAVEVQQLMLADRAFVAVAYVVGTVLACAVGVWFGTTVTRLAGREVRDRRVRRWVERSRP